MSDPVLPGEGPEPMTDEALDAIEARLAALDPIPAPWEAWEHEGDTQIGADAGQFVAHIGQSSWPNTPLAADLIANAPVDLRRLLDEVQRLRKQLGTFDFPDAISIGSQQVKINALTAELERSRSECAAQAAKIAELEGDSRLVQARAAGWDEGWEAGCESDPDSLLPGNNPYRADPGMPHALPQEAREYRCRECNRWAPWTDGTLAADNDGVALFWCQHCSAEMRLDSMDSRPQERASGPETPQAGSGRGTGVPEPHARPQGSLPVEEGP